jgi:hypothetical protein
MLVFLKVELEERGERGERERGERFDTLKFLFLN